MDTINKIVSYVIRMIKYFLYKKDYANLLNQSGNGDAKDPTVSDAPVEKKYSISDSENLRNIHNQQIKSNEIEINKLNKKLHDVQVYKRKMATEKDIEGFKKSVISSNGDAKNAESKLLEYNKAKTETKTRINNLQTQLQYSNNKIVEYTGKKQAKTEKINKLQATLPAVNDKKTIETETKKLKQINDRLELYMNRKETDEIEITRLQKKLEIIVSKLDMYGSYKIINDTLNEYTMYDETIKLYNSHIRRRRNTINGYKKLLGEIEKIELIQGDKQ